MLHIIFFILKLILLLIAAALAVILIVLLSVLLAPVRYQGEISLHEKFSVHGRISWLFHLISGSFAYGEEGGETELHILWFHPFQEKAEDAELVTAMEDRNGESAEEAVFPGPTEFPNPRENEGETEEGEEEQEIKEFKPETLKEEKEQRKGLFTRIGDKTDQIKKRLLLAVRQFRKNILKLKQQKDSLSSLLSDENNKKTFHLLISEGKRIFRKLFPEIRGSVSFGVEDPYLMGQILTVLAVFYPCYGRTLETTAVFDENVLEGDVSVKGKLRFGTFVVSGLRVLGDRNFRTLMKRFLREGGV